MDFNMSNGVFDPDNNPKTNRSAPRRGSYGRPASPSMSDLPIAPEDLVGIGALILEVLFLFLFRDAIFYSVIQPLLLTLLNISAVLLYIGGLLLGAFVGLRSLFTRRRDRYR